MGDKCSGSVKARIIADMQKKNLDEDRIASALHLGWWVVGGANEKKRRAAVRASTFLDIVSLKLRAELIPTQLQANYRRTQEDLDSNIEMILNSYSQAVRSDGASTLRQFRMERTSVRPEWMPSMLNTSGQPRPRESGLARTGLETASGIMNRAWAFLVRAQTPGTAGRNHYERWFGSYDSARYAKVKSNFKMIHDVICSSTVCVHLRTSDTVGKPDDSPGVARGELITQTIVTANGPYNIDDLYAWAIPRGSDGKPHVFLCGVYYSTNGGGDHEAIKRKERGSGADNVGGVMIHELSHSMCGTKDEVHPTLGDPCYGRPLCSDLALSYPELAINNADNYEIFCEDTEGLDL